MVCFFFPTAWVKFLETSAGRVGSIAGRDTVARNERGTLNLWKEGCRA
jgi:hypothetical protein